jgi:hypothetical protein
VELGPALVNEIHFLGLNSSLAVCSLLSRCSVPCCRAPRVPEQVHIALTGRETEMSVTWTTSPDASKQLQVVHWGLSPDALTHSNAATCTTFTVSGWLGLVHHSVMTGLNRSTRYYYRVGNFQSGDLSPVYSFTTLSYRRDDPVRYFVVGDIGFGDNAQANLRTMLRDTASFDVVLHIGDISYSDGYERIFDDFLRLLSDTLATKPYMALPGNHELMFNFASYRARFSDYTGRNSGSNSNMYYSFDVGSAHFIALDTESVINTPQVEETQLAWLKQDLEAYRQNGATTHAIVMSHRPLYCTTKDDMDCGLWADYLQARLEPLFHEYGVVLAMAGHVHNMARTWPMYAKARSGNETSSHVFNAPRGTTYLVNGAGGNREGVKTHWMQPQPRWSAGTYGTWGFNLLTVVNSTRLTVDIHAAQDAFTKRIDYFQINN